MTTNNPETTATATAPQGVKPHRLIKLGVDVHWRQYVVVRQIDGAAPQPPQRFTPEEFVAWAKKQTQLADEVHCCYEAGPFGFVRSRSMGSGRNVQRGAVDTFAQAAHHGFTRFGLHVSPSPRWPGIAYLAGLARDPKMQERQEFEQLSHGWAIGSAGWRRALAKEHAARTLAPGCEREQLRELNETLWREELQRVLGERGLSSTDFVAIAQPMVWKIAVAAELRCRVAAPYRWIANALKIDRPASMRSQVHRCSLRVSP